MLIKKRLYTFYKNNTGVIITHEKEKFIERGKDVSE
jgi:hypothetical protein